MIKHRYSAPVSTNLIDYLNSHGISFKIDRMSSSITFDTDLPSDEFPENHYSVFDYLEFSQLEMLNAEWYLIRIDKKGIPLIYTDRSLQSSEHFLIQTNDFIVSNSVSIGDNQIITDDTHSGLLFCDRIAKERLSIYGDICFRPLRTPKGIIRDDIFQIICSEQAPLQAFSIHGAEYGELREATITQWEDGIRVHPRHPSTYLPFIKRSFFEGRDFVSTAPIWGPGFGYSENFCSHNVFMSLKSWGLDKNLIFYPIMYRE